MSWTPVPIELPAFVIYCCLDLKAEVENKAKEEDFGGALPRSPGVWRFGATSRLGPAGSGGLSPPDPLPYGNRLALGSHSCGALSSRRQEHPRSQRVKVKLPRPRQPVAEPLRVAVLVRLTNGASVQVSTLRRKVLLAARAVDAARSIWL